MKRGQVWTVAGGSGYSGKPRPVTIIQDDRFDATSSITVCPFTSHLIDAPLFRISISPTVENGLVAESQLMVDKIVTVPKVKLDSQIGLLSDSQLVQLNRALATFLGIGTG